MKNWIAATVFGALSLAAGAAQAETCGGTYVVQSGDTLSAIADKMYKKASNWTAIHNNNLKAIGPKPSQLRVGTPLKLACIAGLPTGLADGVKVEDIKLTSATPLPQVPGNASVSRKINLMTGTDYAPFTHQDLENGGMLTDVVNAAFNAADPEQGYSIHWINDWNAHFEPLLANAFLDLSFPWRQPDCEAEMDSYRCENLMFSDPMFEMLIVLFAPNGSPLAYNTDADMHGKTLCRPSGYTYHDFDSEGRNWLRDNLVTLVKPRTVKDCFDMVLAGEADAVTINEFTGRDALKAHDMSDAFRVLPQPMSVAGLHVVVHKSHPQAEALLAEANDGLREIRKNGTYQDIVERHLARIYANF